MQNRNFLIAIFVVTISIFSAFFYGIGRSSATSLVHVQACEEARDAKISAQIEAEEASKKARDKTLIRIGEIKGELELIAQAITRLHVDGKKESLNIWLDIYCQKFEEYSDTLNSLKNGALISLPLYCVLPSDMLDKILIVNDKYGRKKYEVFFASDGAVNEDSLSFVSEDDTEILYQIVMQKRE